MSDPARPWSPRLPVAGLTLGVGSSASPGILARVRDGLGVASVMARKGATPALAERVRAHHGLRLPAGPRREASADRTLLGTGPGAWLMLAERGGNESVATLARELKGVAAVTDQSDAYLVLRLAGPCVRETLAKLVPIDLHPRSFEVDAVAATTGAHIGITLWRLEDSPEAIAAFEMALARSLARSFWHSLAQAAAEFGFAGHTD